MINLVTLAKKYQEILGDDFLVVWNANTAPEESTRTVTTLQATRIPFGLGNVGAETLNVKLTFDLLLIPVDERNRRAEIIKGLLGWNSFDVTETYTDEDGDYTVTYNCDSFLEQKQPLSDPRPDLGILIQQLTVEGTILLCENTTGILTSNRIKTLLNDEELRVITYEAQIDKSPDSNLKLSEGAVEPEIAMISKTNSYVMSVLYTGTEIEKALLLTTEGEAADINQTYELVRIYPDGTYISNICKLANAKVNHQAGAFFTLSLSFVKVPS